jgi:Fur family ferric uptake transcriptional regulator
MSEELSPRALRLRNAGHKLTNARLTILHVLETHDGHLTSAQILDEVTRLDPSIGRASIFRTLELFTRLSIIRPTFIDSSATPTYVMLPNGHHHHIICTNCNRVIEFDECHLDKLEAELESKLHVHLTGHLLEFYGLCQECK